MPVSMVKKKRHKTEKDIIVEPSKKIRKKFLEDMVKCILDIYQTDEYV